MIHVGYYKAPIKNINGTFEPLENVIDRIKTGYQKEQIGVLRGSDDVDFQKEYKANNLDYVTFSAICESGYRDNKHVKQFTGILCFDTAEISEDLEGLRKRLEVDPYVVCLFLAPRGKDFKILFKTDCLQDLQDVVYRGGRKYLWDTYKLKTDNTQDIVRACFMSYDPDIYFNLNKKSFNVSLEASHEKRSFDEVKKEITDKNRHVPLLELATKYANKLYLTGGADLLNTDNLDVYIFGHHALSGRTDRKDTERIIADARKYVLQNPPAITKTSIGRKEVIAKKTLSLSERVSDTPSIVKYFTGMPALDASVNGFRPGNTYLVGGIEKCGKSSLLVTFVNNFLKQGIKTAYLNTELPDDEFISRITSNYSDIAYREIETRTKEKNEWLDTYSKTLCYAGVSDLSNESQLLDFEITLAHAEEFAKQGVKIFCFDNLTSFSHATDKKQGWEVLSSATSRIINFSKKHNVTSFVVIHTKPATVFTETPTGLYSLIKQGNIERIFQESVSVVKKPSLSDTYGGGQMQSQLSGAILVWLPLQKYDKSEYRSIGMIVLDSLRHSASGDMVPVLFQGDKFKYIEREVVKTKIDQAVDAITADDYPL